MFIPLAILGTLFLLGAASGNAKPAPPLRPGEDPLSGGTGGTGLDDDTAPGPPLPDEDFDYMEEDEGDLILEEDDMVYEGSGYDGVPIAQMESIQYYLLELDFYRGEIHGLFTDATQSAIQEFQSWVNLVPSGEPTPETIQTLAEVIVNMQDDPVDPGPFSPDAPAPNVLIVEGFYPSGLYPDLTDIPYPRIEIRGDRVSVEQKAALVAPYAQAYPGIWFVVYQQDADAGWPTPSTSVRGATSMSQWTSGFASQDATLGPKIQETVEILGL
jgi:hypothetical protein